MSGAERAWLVDGRVLQSGSAVRGIGSYLRGLLRGMCDIGADERIELLLRRGDPDPELPPGCRARPGPRLPVLLRRVTPISDPFLVATVLAARRPALYHAVEWAQPIVRRVPVVVTVHDLIPFVIGDGYAWMRRERLLALRQLRGADAVITPSQSTADDVVRLARVDPARITVVAHGVDPAFRPTAPTAIASVRDRLGIAGDYLLAVGTFDPHKRLDVLLAAATTLCAAGGPELVIAGDQANYSDAVSQAVARSPVAGRIHLAGRQSRDDLVALYSGARCLLHASAYEGFGLPLLEAMACGCPVVAFANSAIGEVLGDAGFAVADGDAEALASAAARLLGDEGERQRLVAAGLERTGGFTWARAAAATVEVYRRVQR